MPLQLGRVRGNSEAGVELSAQKSGGAPGAYERQIRKNRTQS